MMLLKCPHYPEGIQLWFYWISAVKVEWVIKDETLAAKWEPQLFWVGFSINSQLDYIVCVCGGEAIKLYWCVTKSTFKVSKMISIYATCKATSSTLAIFADSTRHKMKCDY